MTDCNYHLRDLDSLPFSDSHKVPPKFRKFFDSAVLPLIELKGYKRPEQIEIATHAVHRLITSGLRGACLSDPRDTSQAGSRMRNAVWDSIVAAGLAYKCVGSEESGRVTRYRSTSTLLDLKKNWPLPVVVDTELERNSELTTPTFHALLCLHTGKVDLATGELLPDSMQKQPVPLREHIEQYAQRGPNHKADPRAVSNGLEYAKQREDLIERINRENLKHSWQAFSLDPDTNQMRVFPPNPCIKQIHVGRLHRAARYYTFSDLSGQSLSKDVRRTMLIDGEEVAELDFSAMAIRMLYQLARRNERSDVYWPDRIFTTSYAKKPGLSKSGGSLLRGFVKRATNICLNASSRTKAVQAVRKALIDSPDTKFLSHSVYQIEKLKPSTLVDRIVETHPKVAHRFFSGVGMELMTVDGQIMIAILEQFVLQAAKPALPIHDSLICKASDAELAKKIMRNVYRSFIGFYPVISRNF